MKKIYQIMLIVTLSLGLSSLIYSCADDDSNNEWDMSYVTLLPADYLTPIPTFALTHVEEEGIEGSLEFQFVAAVSKAAKQDVKAYFDFECDGFSEDNVEATSEFAIVKAGSRTSDTITISVRNWGDLEDVKTATNCTLKIRLKDIETTAEDVGSSVYYKEIVLRISKTAEKPKENKLLTNAKDWIFTFMEGVENSESNSVAGTGSSDVATNGVPFWLTVDLKTIKTVTGVQTRHWGATYAPTKVEIFTSSDGVKWITAGVYVTKGSTQTITFGERVKTRYLKYQMIDVPNRVDITRFYIYSYE